MEWRRGEYEVSDDAARIDVGVVHGFLTGTYWSEGVGQEIVAKAIRNSLCFGVYREGELVGFARCVTDRATFAYVCDVFVAPAHRGRGLGKWLVECLLAHPDLQGLRRICLMTRDAHSLYRAFGFRPMPDATRYLEIHRPDVYRQSR
jgi:ribosomal protein S18 acetylase RimI-like enzyme